MDAGLDYVSCSPYSIPIALLAAAQAELDKEGREALSVPVSRMRKELEGDL
jgi:pyruvate,orthophosphate dikinase